MQGETSSFWPLFINFLIAVGTIGASWAAFANIRRQNKPCLNVSVELENAMFEGEEKSIIRITNTGSFIASIYEVNIGIGLWIIPFPKWFKVNRIVQDSTDSEKLPHRFEPGEYVEYDILPIELTERYYFMLKDGFFAKHKPSAEFIVNNIKWFSLFFRVSMQNRTTETVRLDPATTQMVAQSLQEFWESGDQAED